MKSFLFLLLASVVSAATEYPLCTSQQSQQVYSSLSNEISQCKATSTYDLAGSTLPTTTQRASVCQCTALIKQLPNIRLPRCKITLEDNPYKFKDAITSVFAECGGVTVMEQPLPASQAGSKDQEETGAEADIPTPTTTTPKPTPATNQTSSSQQEDASAGSIEAPTTKPPTKAPTTTKPPVTSGVPSATPAPTSAATTMPVATVATMILSVMMAALVA